MNASQCVADRIERFPNAWQSLDEDVRRCRLARFPYGLITKQIVDIASSLGIAVHDHIIVGKNGHASLKGLKLM